MAQVHRRKYNSTDLYNTPSPAITATNIAITPKTTTASATRITVSTATMRFAAFAASLLAASPFASATTDCTWRYDSKRNFNYYYISTDFGGKVPANFCKDVWRQFDPNNAEGYCTRVVDTKCSVVNGVGTAFFWVAIECQNSKIENGLSLFLPPKEAVCTQVKTCPV